MSSWSDGHVYTHIYLSVESLILAHPPKLIYISGDGGGDGGHNNES